MTTLPCPSGSPGRQGLKVTLTRPSSLLDPASPSVATSRQSRVNCRTLGSPFSINDLRNLIVTLYQALHQGRARAAPVPRSRTVLFSVRHRATCQQHRHRVSHLCYAPVCEIDDLGSIGGNFTMPSDINVMQATSRAL